MEAELPAKEKLSEQIMVRIAPSFMKRVGEVCVRKKVKPADLARQGLAEIVERYEAEAPLVDAETAALVAQARAMGINLSDLIRAALSAAA